MNNDCIFNISSLSYDNLAGYFDNVIINSDLLNLFNGYVTNCMGRNGSNLEQQKKLLYLLYNEYISVCDINNAVDFSRYNTKLTNMYGYSHNYFVRDFIPTLLYVDYGNGANITSQLRIIDNMLTDSEKDIIRGWFDNNVESYADKLVRYETSTGIELSEIEKNSEALSKCSTAINSTDPDIRNASQNILKKIMAGTIH